MSVNYSSPIPRIANHFAQIVDDKGYVQFGYFTTDATPSTTTNVFQKGCIMTKKDAISGVSSNYENIGTLVTPIWALMDTGLAFTLPSATTDSTTTTGTSASFVQNLVTTGIGFLQSLTALTTGIGHRVTAAAATLTTGRYFSAFDGALEVWGIGANGHVHTTQTTAPTIAVTTANGISAAAITAGSTDVCGIITTTGTNDNVGATVLTVTFNKTYTTAPKTVSVTPRNASAAKAAATSLALPYVSSITATTFVLTIPADASAGATPSFQYQVIA
jgi:hypothetical protein